MQSRAQIIQRLQRMITQCEQLIADINSFNDNHPDVEPFGWRPTASPRFYDGAAFFRIHNEMTNYAKEQLALGA